MEAKLIKIDRNGSKHFEGYIPCDRCGGDGVYKWGAMISYGYGPAVPQYSGTCFKCGGAGKVLSKWVERTPEYQAKLDAQREKRQAKAQAEREAAWAKEREEQIKKAQAEAKAKAEREAAEAARKAISQFVGNVGDKITVTVTLEKEFQFSVPSFRGYGEEMMSIYTFVDDAGNKLVWKTSGSLGTWSDDGMRFDRVMEGDRVTIRGTVKEHSEYKSEKQTVLQRVKLA